MSSAASFLSISDASGSPAEAAFLSSGDEGLDAMKPTMLHGRHDRKIETNALCDQNAGRKATSSRHPGTRRDGERVSSVLGRDLVKERVTQTVGVGIPLPRPLVGGKRGRPQ